LGECSPIAKYAVKKVIESVLIHIKIGLGSVEAQDSTMDDVWFRNISIVFCRKYYGRDHRARNCCWAGVHIHHNFEVLGWMMVVSSERLR
jgi:hypothetical protein